jgi:hypothetical protein
MAFIWPRDANPYLAPTDRRHVYAAVRREADRAWQHWLAEHPSPDERAWVEWTAYQKWLAS